jgi:hypothetical protein
VTQTQTVPYTPTPLATARELFYCPNLCRYSIDVMNALTISAWT